MNIEIDNKNYEVSFDNDKVKLKRFNERTKMWSIVIFDRVRTEKHEEIDNKVISMLSNFYLSQILTS